MFPPLPWVPSYLHAQHSPNVESLLRPFLSPMGPDFGDTQNSPQTGSPLPSDGSVQLTLYRFLRGPEPSSQNRTRMRRWHLPLLTSGN